MQTNNVTTRLGLNQWTPGDKLNTGQFTKDNALVDTAVMQLDATIERIFGLLVPTGTILPFGGQPDISKDPPGFLYLTPGGREVSRTTYAALFAVLGTTYGSGNGSTTFKLPDLADRVPLGYSANRGRGTTGGSSTHTLSESELPIIRKGLVYGYADQKVTLNGGTYDGYKLSWTGATASHKNEDLFVQFGGGLSHNNMPPNIALAYIIKT